MSPSREHLQKIAEFIKTLPPEQVEVAQNIYETYSFVSRLLDPEGFGLAVSAEVRDEARKCLGMPKVETKFYQ
jgi:hypothetical protein